MRRKPKDVAAELLKKIEGLVAARKFSAATDLLKALSPSRMSRDHCLQYATFAQTCGQTGMVMRALGPYVHQSAVGRPAVLQETVLYSASLLKVGALEEAIDLLEGLQGNQLPTAFLYHSHALMALYNYGAAITLLQKYLATENLSETQKILGQLNLVSCFIAEAKFDDAGTLLKRLDAASRKEGRADFIANTLGLLAQHSIAKGAWKDAEKFLAEAQTMLRDARTIDEFYIRKWQAILTLKSTTEADREKPLLKIREEAVLKNHWEAVRECDFFLATTLKDEARALKVYFGTPSEAFRARVLKDFDGLKIPEPFELKLGKGHAQFSLIETEALLHGFVGKKYRLLRVLSSDLYRPLPPARIHFLMNPGEAFHNDDSPTEVRKAVSDLQASIKGQDLGLEFEHPGGSYRISEKSNVVLRIPQRIEIGTPDERTLAPLYEKLGNSLFTPLRVVQVIQCSRRQAARLIEIGVQKGFIVTMGNGDEIQYKFGKSPFEDLIPEAA